jgi:hypothetical protein
MDFRVGDSIFNVHGQPGVIKEHRRDTGEYIVDNKTMVKEGPRKFGYINGLSEPDRKSFQDIMEKVHGMSDPKERVQELKTLVDSMLGDPQRIHLHRYLQAELAHIMHSYGIKQNVYSISELAVQSG